MKVWAPITTANSIHLSGLIQLLHENSNKSDEITLTWVPAFLMYPTKMIRGLDGLTQRKAIRFLLRLGKSFSDINGLDSKMNVVQIRKFDMKSAAKDYLAVMKQLRHLSHINDLERLNSQKAFLGSALANLIASETRDEFCDLKRNRLKLWVAVLTYFRIYFLTLQFIQREKPGLVYIYNGRFLYERAISDALRNFPSIETCYFETIRNRVVSTSHGFHNRILMQEEMLKFGRQFSKQEIIDIGFKYYSDLRSKRNTFVRNGKDQSIKLREYICFFTSSDDEYVGFWDTRVEHFGNQIEAIKTLSECAKELDIKVIIRLHPNLLSKPGSVQERWKKSLNHLSLQYYEAEHPISSQFLIENSLGVVTYGSTIGLEAVAYLKPSLTLVDSIYDLLGCVSKATTKKDILEWLQTLRLTEKQHVTHEQLAAACLRGLWIEKAGSLIEIAELKESKWGAWEATKILNLELKRPSKFERGHLINRAKRITLGCRY